MLPVAYECNPDATIAKHEAQREEKLISQHMLTKRWDQRATVIEMGSNGHSYMSKKVQKCHFEFFFLFFFKTPVIGIKMIFQTQNKGGSCFKHYNFLDFDEKQLPPKILVPWSFKLA